MMTSNNENESKLKTELKSYHKKTLDAFEKENLEAPYEVRMQKKHVDDFLRRAKEDKTPILKIIKTMKRIPIVVRDENGKAVKKDYLEINSELFSKDWKDNDLRVIDYIEGYHYEPTINTSTGDGDAETGDFKMNKEHQGNRQIHDIELTDKNRKDTITSMIEGATGTYRDEMKFYYEVPNSNKGMGFRCGVYTFETWLNSNLEELENLARTTPSPISYSKKDMKSYMA
jgi:hypothetical protein